MNARLSNALQVLDVTEEQFAGIKHPARRSKPRPRWPMFLCQECGRRFYTTAAAERAANNGCPDCGGKDIDLG